MKNLMAASAAFTIMMAMTPPAVAQEVCTEEGAGERQEKLMAFMGENPDKAPQVLEIIKGVETEYGGEPNEDQVCEAIDKVLERAEAL